MSRVKNDTDLLLIVRQDKKSRVKKSRVRNDADLLLRPVDKSKTRQEE